MAASFAIPNESGEAVWLNAFLKETWPFVSRAILLELRERLQPAVNAFMPQYLPAVVFTRLDLGNIPPRITSIAVHDAAAQAKADAAISGEYSATWGQDSRDADASVGWGDADLGPAAVQRGSLASSASGSSSTSNASQKAGWGSRGVAAEALVFEVGVEYKGKLNVEMALESAMGTTFGIDSAKLSGKVEVVVSPLVPRVPLATAFQAGFLNRPSIEFNLTGIAAAGNMKLWTGAFRAVVDKVFASFVVLPNRVSLRIDPAVDFLDMAHVTRPVGVLRVAVLRGDGFPHTDESAIKQTLGQSAEPDVYISLRLGATEYSTGRVDDSEHPVFDSEVFDFVLSSNSARQKLFVEAYDYDLGKDDELGDAAVTVEALVREPECVLRLDHSPLGATPRLRLRAQFVRLSTVLADIQSAVLAQRDPARPPSCSALLLAVAIDRARGLPIHDGTRPFVRVMLEDRKVLQTWPAIESCAAAYGAPVDSPCWEFARHVPLEKGVDAGSRVTFEVRDAADSNSRVGYAFLLLTDLLRKADCAKVYNFALVDCKRPGATLRVRVGLEAAVADGTPLWVLSSAKRQRAKLGRSTSDSSLGKMRSGNPGSMERGVSNDGSLKRSARALRTPGSWETSNDQG